MNHTEELKDMGNRLWRNSHTNQTDSNALEIKKITFSNSNPSKYSQS